MERQIAEPSRWIIEEWATKLQEVVQSMTDVRPEIRLEPGVEAGPPAAEGAFWQELPLSLAPDTSVIVGATEQSWFAIGEMALKAVGLENVEPADARNTYLEIVNQSTSMLAQLIGRRLGREVNVMPSQEQSGAPGATFTAVLLTAGNLVDIPIQLGISPALESLFRVPEASATEGKAPGTQIAPAGTADGLQGTPIRSKTLDLLMEVELPISVSFGRTRLQLRDVLKLTSGSIVELNRTVSEPVEIIINGAVVARGEVVVVEGNYGVRIDKIISRQERLRTLK